MNNNRSIWYFAGLALLVAVVSTIFFSNRVVDWSLSYDHKSRQPYGTAFLFRLLKEAKGNDQVIVAARAMDEFDFDLAVPNTYSYLYLGHRKGFTTYELNAFLEFVEMGNDAMICANEFSEELLDTLFSGRLLSILPEPTDSVGYPETDSILTEELLWEVEEQGSFSLQEDREWVLKERLEELSLNFEDLRFCVEAGYPLQYVHQHDTLATLWSFFDPSITGAGGENPLRVMGYADSKWPYFIALRWGKGHIYLHTVPLALTNLALLDREQLGYVEKLMAYLPGEQLYWDTYSYTPPWENDIRDNEANSPLSYILSERTLRWAVYMALALAILFVLFRAKRRQPHIPVIPENRNTSLDFVRMLGQLHYEKQDHRYIAQQLWKQFRDFAKERYYMAVDGPGAEWIPSLSKKSGVNEHLVNGIVRAYAAADQRQCTQDDLLNFYKKLNYFYSICK